MSILWVFESDDFVFQTGSFARYNVENRFFTIYDIRIQGVTRGYREFQGVTRVYRGLQGVQGTKRAFTTQGFLNTSLIIESCTLSIFS